MHNLLEERPLKFRGVGGAKDSQKIYYGTLSVDNPDSTEYYKTHSQRICWSNRPEGGEANIPVLNGTVGQFTGVCDEDGCPVYEGDIIESAAIHDVVVFKSSGFTTKKSIKVECLYNHYPFKIVGNIFDIDEVEGDT